MPSHPAMSSSLPPHGLQPTRLLCPLDSPGKSTGVGYHALFISNIMPPLIWQEVLVRGWPVGDPCSKLHPRLVTGAQKVFIWCLLCLTCRDQPLWKPKSSQEEEKTSPPDSAGAASPGTSRSPAAAEDAGLKTGVTVPCYVLAVSCHSCTHNYQLFTAKAIRPNPLIEGVNYYKPGKEGLIVNGPPSTWIHSN